MSASSPLPSPVAGPAPAPSPSRLRWGAIAIGAATDIGSSELSATLIVMSIGIRMPASDRAADLATAQAAAQAVMATPPVFIFSTAVGLLCSAAGGYLTAYLAKDRELLHAAITGICSVVAGSLVFGTFSRSSLDLTHLALTAATVPAAMLGGLLARVLLGRGRGRF